MSIPKICLTLVLVLNLKKKLSAIDNFKFKDSRFLKTSIALFLISTDLCRFHRKSFYIQLNTTISTF